MIDIIFAGINFLILVALAVYGYIVYALPGIRYAIQEQQSEHDKLIAQRTQLRETCRHIENHISQQETQYHELYDVMAQWAQVVEKARREREHAYRATRQQLRDRRYQQHVYRVQRKALQAYVPQAFAQAEQELRNRYAGDAGKQYIQQVVQRVEHSNG